MKKYRLLAGILSTVLLFSAMFTLPSLAGAESEADSSSVPAITYEDILNHPELQTELKQYLSDYRELVEPDMLDAYDDYVYYLITSTKHRKYEALAIKAYEKCRVDSVKTRVQSYNGMTRTVIPNYQKFIDLMKTIKPAEPQISKLHQQFIKGATLQLEGFKLLQKYFSQAKRNDSLFYKANDKIRSGKHILDKYNAAMLNYVAQF
ncbi:hypothetical protein [Paenibacillus dauci]|uniref:hypothetical protein n=1 Tax=Paenibacillus dauci TaxID=1567106 RepID=UPI00061910FA|nr:hypothetical protein [Paenibacillus dauci]